MSGSLFAPLIATLRPYFSSSKTRLETLAVLLLGLANTRSVNLSHLASQFPGTALHSSNYRRLQRFFQFERLDGDITAGLVIRLLNLSRPMVLALDRTNWKVGSRDVNVLVLAVVTRRFRIPLMWTQLGRAGNSDTAQRVALLQRYLDLFGAETIDVLLADREFIGAKWLEFLCENNISFAIRLRGNMRLHTGGRTQSFATLLRQQRRRTWAGRLEGMERDLRFAAKRLSGGEVLIVATNTVDAARVLSVYRKRWGIECLFGDVKTRGLNLEDTRLTDPEKLDTLMSVVALSVAWAYCCATAAKGRGGIRRKAHGRREKSWFRIGLDALRNWLLHDPQKAFKALIKSLPKRKMV